MPLCFFALLLCSLLAVSFTLSAGDEISENPLYADYLREEKEYYDQLTRNVTEKCEVYFDPITGRCAWLNSDTNSYERPALKYDFTEEDFKCVSAFHSRIFSPSCGDPMFEMVKYCAKVKFYRNMAPEEGGISEENKGLLLLLLDGCLVCLKAKADQTLKITVSMKLIYKFKAGSFFTACSEETIETEPFTLSLDKQQIRKHFPIDEKNDLPTDAYCNGACIKKEYLESVIEEGHRHFGTFSMPTTLLQRECRGLFSSDEENKFYDVYLKVEHNCEESKAMHIPLASEVKLDIFKQNVAEVRGLYINLGANSVFQYQALMEKGNYRVIKKPKDTYIQNVVEFGNRKRGG